METNKSFFASCVLGLLTGLFSAQTVVAQENSKPWWNPFASDTQAEPQMDNGPVRDSSLFTGGNSKSFFKLPDWELPSWSKDAKSSAPKSSKGPSTLSRMGNTSKRWWDNTVDFVNPFDAPKEKFTQGYQPQYMQPKSKPGSGLFGWMWREESVESPTTVNDFLRQPRPKF